MDLPIRALQTSELSAALPSSHQPSSIGWDSVDRGLRDTANRPVDHTPSADAALEQHARRTMHALALPPPPTLLPSAPFGRRQEPLSSLAKLHSQFSPTRSEQHNYPSPPMSDSHSPTRRSAHLVEPAGLSYPPPVSDPRISEAFHPPPPPPPHFDPRPSAASAHGMQYQRPLYAVEAPRGQPMQYHHTGRALEPPNYGSMQMQHNFYPYPAQGVPALGSQGPGSHGQQPSAMIAPPPMRPTKPARRTKAHVASACVNCKKAHLSCDVQRPCGRCVTSGKQVSGHLTSELALRALLIEMKSRTPAGMCNIRKGGDQGYETTKSLSEAKMEDSLLNFSLLSLPLSHSTITRLDISRRIVRMIHFQL
jgi:hypothetical protein